MGRAPATRKARHFDDLAEARRFTAKLREKEPGLLAAIPGRRLYGAEAGGEQRRPITEDIAEQRRFAEEWKRKNLARYGTRRRVLFSVPVLRGAWSLS